MTNKKKSGLRIYRELANEENQKLANLAKEFNKIIDNLSEIDNLSAEEYKAMKLAENSGGVLLTQGTLMQRLDNFKGLLDEKKEKLEEKLEKERREQSHKEDNKGNKRPFFEYISLLYDWIKSWRVFGNKTNNKASERNREETAAPNLDENSASSVDKAITELKALKDKVSKLPKVQNPLFWGQNSISSTSPER